MTNLTLQAATVLAKSIVPNKEVLNKSLTPELFATHRAFELTKKGIPFRDAYNTIGKNIHANKEVESIEIIIPLHITQLKKDIEKQEQIFLGFKKKHNRL